MRKTILRVMYSAVLATIICIGCGGDDGGQTNSLKVSDLLNAITGGGTQPTQTTYTLTVNVSQAEGGSVSRNPNKTSYNPGESVTLTATHTDGYRFTGWSGNANDTTATVTVIMNSNLELNANFVSTAVITYTLTVVLEPSVGGNVLREPNLTVYRAGEEVKVTAAALSGYTFTGWSGDANGANTTVIVTMNRDLTITANFQQQTYSLSISANPASGGTVSRDPQKTAYTYGEQVTVTATPAKGYTFNGWADNAAPANQSVTVTIDGNKTLTAIFEQQTYKLTTTASPNGYGSVLRNPNKETYTYGEQVTVTATPAAKSGDKYYSFTGWAGALESTSNEVTLTMDGNKTLTAKFQQESVPSYTLATITNHDVGTKISRNPDNASYKEGQTVTVTAPTNLSGYEFTGWSGASTSANPVVTIIMDGNKTLTANYKQNDYTLTVEIYPANSGSVSRNPNNNAYTYNQTVTLTATPANGYKFTGWSGAATGISTNATVTMNSNKSLIANFEQITYSLETPVSPSGGGSVSRSLNKDVYNYNDPVTLTPMAASCYTFTGWSGDATGTTNPLGITINGNKKITANFSQLGPYTLTTNVSPAGGGSVSRSPNQTNYTCGTSVTVTAAAASGYTFTGWSGASTSTNASAAITMDGNKTLTANFQLIPIPQYTLTTSVNPSGGGTVSRSPNQTSYESETSVLVTATPNTGYEFTGWSDATSGTTNPVTITMNGNKTLTANFQQIPYTVTVSSTGIGASIGGSYVAGTTVTITAGTAPSGYVFKNWTTTSSGVTFANANSATTTFIMPTNAVIVTANNVTGITDSRDSKTYRTVRIGSQNWMAENLNYAVDSSWCSGGRSENCAKYGRLYQWSSAMGIEAKYNSEKWNGSDVKRKGVCPTGWHLPSRQEWDKLMTEVGGSSTAGKKLKSTSGWYNDGNGTDDYGFSALPGGIRDSDGRFYNAGYYGEWWMATEYDGNYAYLDGYIYLRSMSYDHDGVGENGYNHKSSGQSVRCLED